MNCLRSFVSCSPNPRLVFKRLTSLQSVAASKSRRRLSRRYPGGQWLPQPSSLPPHLHQDCKRPLNLQPPSGRIISRSFSNAPKTDFQTSFGNLPARAALKKYGATKVRDELPVLRNRGTIVYLTAIVYARAPPSFQNRYFSFRPSTPPVDTTSALSLDVPPSLLSRTPSPVQCQIPLRLTTSINPTLFSNELEYLYTSQGFGEAFEFLFDSSDGEEHDDPESMRIDKLRKDLVFMWRSRLYSDVRIALTGNFSSSHENTTAIFSSHRFILVSRSPYFRNALLDWPSTPSTTLNLPSPPFTPASLHFTLGFIYTGTLIFSHRSYDLSTAFAILRSALYLAMPSLQDEIQARIAQEMLHGLFHAFLPFSEYERITGGKWGTGGCRCRQCARRAPRVLEFALSEDVKNAHLERGARRALVGLFGEGWCTSEFASLAPKLRESLLKGLGKRTTPLNVFPLLFAAEHALVKIGAVIEPWGDTVRDMLVAARKAIDETICKESEACFESAEWMEVMEGDGVRFEDGERVEWVMKSVMRGVKEIWAAPLYQVLYVSLH